MNCDNESQDSWHKKKEDLQSSEMIWQEDQDSWWKISLFNQNQWEQQDSEIQDLLNHSEFSSTKRDWLQQNLCVSSSRFNNTDDLHCCCCQKLTCIIDKFYHCLSQQIAAW